MFILIRKGNKFEIILYMVMKIDGIVNVIQIIITHVLILYK